MESRKRTQDQLTGTPTGHTWDNFDIKKSNDCN